MKPLVAILCSYGLITIFGSLYINFPGFNFIINILMAPLIHRLSTKELFQIFTITNTTYLALHPDQIIYAVSLSQNPLIMTFIVVIMPGIVLSYSYLVALALKLINKIFPKRWNWIFRRIGY